MRRKLITEGDEADDADRGGRLRRLFNTSPH